MDLPDIGDRGSQVHAGLVKNVLGVAGSIALDRNILLGAGSAVVIRDGKVAEHLRGLDDGSSQTHLNVPLNVAVEEVHARVGSLETQHSVRVAHDGDGITTGRLLVQASAVGTGPVTSAGGRALEDLEVVAVKVERVDGLIPVVDDDVDNLAIADNEGVDGAVDGRVGVVLTSGGDGVQGGNLLVDVRAAVHTGAGNAGTIEAELPVELNGRGGVRKDGLVAIGLVDGVVRGLPFRDRIGAEGLALVHDQLAGGVEGPGLVKSLVGPITVDVGGDEEGVVAVVTVDALNQNVVALGGSDADLVGGLLLDVGRINHDQVHVVRVEVQHEGGDGGVVDDTETVGLALLELVVGRSAVVDDNAIRDGRLEMRVGRHKHLLDQGNALIVVPA